MEVKKQSAKLASSSSATVVQSERQRRHLFPLAEPALTQAAAPGPDLSSLALSTQRRRTAGPPGAQTGRLSLSLTQGSRGAWGWFAQGRQPSCMKGTTADRGVVRGAHRPRVYAFFFFLFFGIRDQTQALALMREAVETLSQIPHPQSSFFEEGCSGVTFSRCQTGDAG